ncbi:MAG: amylo-alpha-1,6-glucosidase [Thermoguttaceae bacterium]
MKKGRSRSAGWPSSRNANRRGTAENRFYIVAPASQAESTTLVLKQGDSFAVFDHLGDIKPLGRGEEGIYHEGTRFLSLLTLRIHQLEPLFLSSTVQEDNGLLTVDLTNPDFRAPETGEVHLRRGTLHLFRAKLLWQGVCYERLRIRNYGLQAIQTSLRFCFEADYADIFEVRGTQRKAKGRFLKAEVDHDQVTLAYQGLDKVIRRTQLQFSPSPQRLSASEAAFDLALEPQEEAVFYLTVSAQVGTAGMHYPAYDSAAHLSSIGFQTARQRAAKIETSSGLLNDWITRSMADLSMMVTQTPYGPYPYAGVPWFSTVFGRDGILAARQYLWLDPSLARGVLAYLASTQAQTVNPERDAAPGKILHETRGGEMAALGEVPFGCYYGSVDATPLFVMLAADYYERTGDLAFIESIWSNVERALEWMDTDGDPDRDGFVEYARRSPSGLVQQGWKDSGDSVFHADGKLAHGPIALCEVQGYVYAAKRGAAMLASALEQPERATQLLHQAGVLQSRFEEAFWCPELKTYALALDGEKQPCRVRTSNAGHALFAGIASAEHAPKVAETLLEEASFSGWGIRTVATTEVRFNPMSYHNGSIWPHDNSLIVAGLARYGLMEGVKRVFGALFDASQFLALHRMPELFCGFPRRPGQGPTLYPVACSPQAWASGAVFLVLQSCLGLSIHAPRGQLYFSHPILPAFVERLHLYNLRVGEATLDLLIQRHGEDAAVNVLRREGDVRVIVVK